MKASFTALLSLTVGIAALIACGSDGDGSSSSGSSGESSSGLSSGQPFPTDDGGSDPAFGDVDLASMHVEPANLVLSLTPGQSLTQAYKLMGKLKNQANEIDLTSRAVFYVPDNYLMGGFPLDGSPTFTSRLPVAPTDPPQRGGIATIRATIANADGPHDATTTLTLKLNGGPYNRPGVPADAATKFGGTVDAARAPTLYYPNDGTMLPPNLRRLDVQWKAKGGTNLYEISFKSAVGEVIYYSRCDGGAPNWDAGSCAFELDEAGYNALAYTNAGAGPVTLKIRGTVEGDPTKLGESAEFHIEFAQNSVYGGLYYWNVTQTAIMRFDFGAATGVPDVFADHNSCVGCHALSRDGTKMVASLDGQNNGRLVFTNDVTKVNQAQTSSFTVWDNGPNRIQFASFNPTGSQFVAVYGDTTAQNGPAPADMDQNKLWFHDGTTGLRASSHTLPYRPDHPDWSPDGNMIAFTHINGTGTSQMPSRGNIEMIKKDAAGAWSAPIVIAPYATDKMRFNPNFEPSSAFLYFTESTCPAGQPDSADCNGDSDPTAKTFVATPTANAPLVPLTNSFKRGVIDIENNLADTGDTFPRSAPFQTVHQKTKLVWFTVASRRKAGLRSQSGPQHLWMFAVDWQKVLAGQDGSYTGFYLPFQDLKTSNHIGQWTEKIVGGTQPPPPAPPPPPPPPAPPGPK